MREGQNKFFLIKKGILVKNLANAWFLSSITKKIRKMDSLF